MIRAVRAAHHHLVRDDRSLALQPKRLLRGKVPLVTETFVAVTGAEFPERRIPGCAVAVRAFGLEEITQPFITSCR